MHFPMKRPRTVVSWFRLRNPNDFVVHSKRDRFAFDARSWIIRNAMRHGPQRFSHGTHRLIHTYIHACVYTHTHTHTHSWIKNGIQMISFWIVRTISSLIFSGTRCTWQGVSQIWICDMYSQICICVCTWHEVSQICICDMYSQIWICDMHSQICICVCTWHEKSQTCICVTHTLSLSLTHTRRVTKCRSLEYTHKAHVYIYTHMRFMRIHIYRCTYIYTYALYAYIHVRRVS